MVAKKNVVSESLLLAAVKTARRKARGEQRDSLDSLLPEAERDICGAGFDRTDECFSQLFRGATKADVLIIGAILSDSEAYVEQLLNSEVNTDHRAQCITDPSRLAWLKPSTQAPS